MIRILTEALIIVKRTVDDSLILMNVKCTCNYKYTLLKYEV